MFVTKEVSTMRVVVNVAQLETQNRSSVKERNKTDTQSLEYR